MILANTPKGKIKFKNSWAALSAEEILWYQDYVPDLLEEAFEEVDEGFEKKLVVKNEDAYHKLNYALLTLCCKQKRKLMKLPYAVIAELIEKGATQFYQVPPSFDDTLQKKINRMSVGQFAIADMIHREYKENKSEDTLNLFAAAMEMPFRKEDVEEVALRKQKLKESSKRYLMFRFQVYLNKIVKASPLAFENDPTRDTGEPMDWRESMLQMAKDGPFGDFENIEQNVRFIDYAAEMHRVKKEYKAIKKATKER